MMRFSKIIAVLLLMPFGAMALESECSDYCICNNTIDDKGVSKWEKFKGSFNSIGSSYTNESSWTTFSYLCNEHSRTYYFGKDADTCLLNQYKLPESPPSQFVAKKYNDLNTKIKEHQLPICQKQWNVILDDIGATFGIQFENNCDDRFKDENKVVTSSDTISYSELGHLLEKLKTKNDFHSDSLKRYLEYHDLTKSFFVHKSKWLLRILTILLVLVSTITVFFFLRRRQFIRAVIAGLEENSELQELFQGDDYQKPTSVKIKNPRDILILLGRANSAWTRRYFQLKDEYTLQKNTSGSAPPVFDDPLKSRVQGIESIEGGVSQIHQSASDYLPESSTPKPEGLASDSFSPKQAAPEEPTVFYFKQVNNGGFFPDSNKLLDRNQGLFVVNTGMDRNKGMLTLVEENKERIKEALNAAKYKLDPACEQIGNVMAERASDIIVTSRGEVVLNDKGQWEIREKIKVKYV